VTEDEPAVAAAATDLTRAEEIRLRYAAIVESSDDAIIAKTLDGVISAWNAAAERMFGYTEREALGQPIAIIIPPDLHDEEHDILRRLRSGERVDHYETVRITKAGERIDVSLTISPLRDPAGRIVGCSKIARDVTKAKQAEAAVRQSEQRLAREVAGVKALQSISTRLISESMPEPLYAQILGAAMELMASDAASVQMLAADHSSLKLLAWKNFHPDSAAFWQRVEVGAGSTCSKALGDNARVVVADVEACDFIVGTPDQQEYRRSGIRAVQSTPLQSRSGRPLGMLSTHWRTPHTPTDEDFTFFDVLARQAADLIERTLVEQASSRHGVTLDVHFENIPKALPPEICLCLYRVLQEALQNVVKHRASQHAHVSLNGQIDTINLTVKDSGAGFDLHEVMRGPGLGLTSMKERLKVIDGQLFIQSQRGRGTMIHAVAPLCLPAKFATSRA
jgi:PAS domain S-box-containing protein